jgi:hypothetical protein
LTLPWSEPAKRRGGGIDVHRGRACRRRSGRGQRRSGRLGWARGLRSWVPFHPPFVEAVIDLHSKSHEILQDGRHAYSRDFIFDLVFEVSIEKVRERGGRPAHHGTETHELSNERRNWACLPQTSEHPSSGAHLIWVSKNNFHLVYKQSIVGQICRQWIRIQTWLNVAKSCTAKELSSS